MTSTAHHGEVLMCATTFSMVIPAYNESDCIEEVVEELMDAFDERNIRPAEAVIVDDGSTDDTFDKISSICAKHNNVRTITFERNRGIGAAVREGFENAVGDWFGWMPADGQFNPGDILDAYLQCRSSADMVITTVAARERRRVDNIFRLFLSKSLRWLILAVTGVDSRKVTGIYILRKGVFHDVPDNISTFLFNIVLSALTERRDYRIEHVAIPLRQRKAGQSKVANIRTIFRVFMELLKLKFVGLEKLI